MDINVARWCAGSVPYNFGNRYSQGNDEAVAEDVTNFSVGDEVF